MPLLYAQPYNINADGFYFEDMDEYDHKVQQCFDAFGLPVEEFEIQFIDGDAIDFDLFEVWGIHQGNISQYLDIVDRFTFHKKITLIVLSEAGYVISKNLNTDNVEFHYCDRMRDLAIYLVEEGHYGPISEIIQQYIDYDTLGQDLETEYSEVIIADQNIIYRCP